MTKLFIGLFVFFFVVKGIAGDRLAVRGEKSKRERAKIGEVLGRYDTFLHSN